MVLILMIVAYLYILNKPSEIQKNILGVTITIPNKDGLEAEMTSIKGKNLKGVIKDTKKNKKLSGEVIAYVDQIVSLSDDGSSFILPFELNHENQEKYLYLGIFYFEPVNTSIIDKNKPTKIIKHPYYYLLGKDITLEKIKSVVSGSYSSTINLEYFNNEGVKKDLNLRFYYEKEKFEVAKKCEDIAVIVNREIGDGESYDVCVFDDSHECTLEAYKNGNCPVGGYDVSITEDPIEKWGISQGFLFKNGKFIFPANYENCSISDFYFGHCNIN
jgi:hypothetical protein